MTIRFQICLLFLAVTAFACANAPPRPSDELLDDEAFGTDVVPNAVIWSAPKPDMSAPQSFEVHTRFSRKTDGFSMWGRCRYDLELRLGDDVAVIRQRNLVARSMQTNDERLTRFLEHVTRLECMLLDIEVSADSTNFGYADAKKRLAPMRKDVEEMFRTRGDDLRGRATLAGMTTGRLEQNSLVLFGLLESVGGTRLSLRQAKTMTMDDSTVIQLEWIDQIPCLHTPTDCAVVEVTFPRYDASEDYADKSDEMARLGFDFKVRDEGVVARLVLDKVSGLPQQIAIVTERETRSNLGGRESQDFSARATRTIFEFIPKE